jgi:hypothetical protein
MGSGLGNLRSILEDKSYWNDENFVILMTVSGIMKTSSCQ